MIHVHIFPTFCDHLGRVNSTIPDKTGKSHPLSQAGHRPKSHWIEPNTQGALDKCTAVAFGELSKETLTKIVNPNKSPNQRNVLMASLTCNSVNITFSFSSLNLLATSFSISFTKAALHHLYESAKSGISVENQLFPPK